MFMPPLAVFFVNIASRLVNIQFQFRCVGNLLKRAVHQLPFLGAHLQIQPWAIQAPCTADIRVADDHDAHHAEGGGCRRKWDFRRFYFCGHVTFISGTRR